MNEKKFNVACWWGYTKEPTHWAEGLKMIIEKDGVSIKLEEDEIKKVIKSLPRTFGGSYK